MKGPPKKKQHGKCYVCGRVVDLDVHGRISVHAASGVAVDTKNSICIGSKQPPVYH